MTPFQKVFCLPLVLLPPLTTLTGCFNTQESSRSTQASSSEKTAPHQQVIALLQNSDEVIPPRPDIYPVAAMYNREAIIPPMCYTRTEGKNNPCYVCHQDSIEGRENVMNDADLQEAYSFSDLGTTNHWQNLFINRELRVAGLSDEAIIDWVNTDNYSDLAPRLKAAGFKGWIPDINHLQNGAKAFDEEGFAKDGSHWVAFNYKPFPSTFWPTNGSTDDVMIKLDTLYRTNKQGQYSRDIYKANLAIVEAKIKGLDHIESLPIDEKKVGVDLDGNGKLTIATMINQLGHYVGAAQDQFIDSHLYPRGTEFLHTVRYLGFDQQGDVTGSTRMKEVRYMKKWRNYPKAVMARFYEEEAFEKEAGNLPGFTHLGDYGLDNDSGWSIQGFIENKNGNLRVASFEENTFCMGCHSSIGSTIDKTFSFARKVDGAAGWGYINLKGMPDAPNQGETQGEIITYFQRAGGGDEFRSNPEMFQRWFTEDGQVDQQAIQGRDVYSLITPSKQRALMLNKAYKLIVEDQSFIYGRDATYLTPSNVYEKVNNENSPTLEKQHIYAWDIRLDWSKGIKN